MRCPWRVETLIQSDRAITRTVIGWVECDKKNCPFWRDVVVEVPSQGDTGAPKATWIKTCIRKRK